MGEGPAPAARLTRAVIRSAELTGVLYRPEGPGQNPGVVVLGGSEPGAPEQAAATVARAGFAALALAWFGVPPLPGHLREIPVEYGADTAGWLARQNAITGDRVAVLGRSRGAELALLAAACRPEVVAGVVAFAPSSVAWQAPPQDPFRPGPPVSSWTRAGNPVPFAATGPPDVTAAGRVRFRPAFERALAAAPAGAAIPVEDVDGPVLLVSGGRDEMWPSREMAEQLVARRDRVQHLHFPEAGHLIGVPGRHWAGAAGPVMARLETGGSPEADAEASRAAWEPVTGFLAQVLDTTRLTNSRR